MSKVFADNLRTYRQLAHMTQADLAEAADTTRSTINNYESAKSEPSFELLCRFSEVLGVEITDLVTRHAVIPAYIRKVQVTDDESALLQVFREADPVYQSVALDILRAHKKGK